MRRRRPEKRKILKDPIYNDLTVAKFVNYIMKDGKKSIAEKIFYSSLDMIKEKMKTDSPLDVFKKAIDNVGPILEVKSKRIGGATYQVPVEVRSERRNALAMRWLVEHSRTRGEKSMALRLAGEIADASEGRGSAVKKREDVHRMAEANRAFSHYRF